MSLSYHVGRIFRFLSLPLPVQWRAYLVRLPWLVPLPVLHFTSPEGPDPTVTYLPSRGSHRIPVYLFFPSELITGDTRNSASALPVHLDFHGGGFIMGSCLEQGPFCALLARNTGRLTISVDYRKGPLDQFPAAIEDGEDVLAAVMDADEGRTKAGKLLCETIRKHYQSSNSPAHAVRIDAGDVSLSGFSSGGNLALNLIMSMETPSSKGEPQWNSLFAEAGKTIPTLLFYPSLDCRQLPHERPRPEKMKAREHKGDTSAWFGSIGSVLGPTYLPKDVRSHPRASPGLNNMAKCLNKRAQIRLVLPEIDTLAFQSEIWVKQMKDGGFEKKLTVVKEEDMVHGWTQFPDAFMDERARERKYAVLNDAVTWVKEIGLGNDAGVLVDH